MLSDKPKRDFCFGRRDVQRRQRVQVGAEVIPRFGGGTGMALGKVKWFNNAKGYGFILPENGGEDLFAHYSSVEMVGYKTLRAGDDVEFEIEEGPKGTHAVHIRSAGESADAHSEDLTDEANIQEDPEN